MTTPLTDISTLTASLNIEDFKSSTVRSVVIETEPNENYNKHNPDPCGSFPGTNGRWYKIDFPCQKFNCYMFALGWTIKVGHKVGYGYPGILTGRLPESKMDTVNLIMQDLKVLGRSVHELYVQSIPKRLPKAEKGTYWIKIYFEEGTTKENWASFHIARKDETSGRWLHKLGWFAPCKLVLENLVITDLYSYVLMNNPELRERAKAVPEHMLKSFIRAMGYNIDERIVCNSRIEVRDNAPYKVFNPEEDDEHFKILKPFAVMRIDE